MARTPQVFKKSEAMKNFFRNKFYSNVDRTMLITVLLIMIVISIASLTIGLASKAFDRALIAAFIGVLLISLYFAYRGSLSVGQIAVPILAFMMISVFVFRGGVRNPITLGFASVILISGLFLGDWGGLIFGFLSTAVILGVGLSEANGVLDTFLGAETKQTDVYVYAVLMLTATLVQRVLVQRLSQAVYLAQENEHVQALANRELRELQSTLEQRVADRTAAVEESALQIQKRASQLEAIADVSRSISSLQELDQLLPTMARLISERFGFYHVGIFLLDADHKFAELRAANSAGGQKMMMRQHRLRVESTSLVGYAASRSRARIALDVGDDAVFFNNPDLPETRSEIALPLMIGDSVIGVLDVQSQESGIFAQEDATVLGALSNQIAIAIENTRLYDETRRALVKSERSYQQYIASGWKRATEKALNVGYQFYGSVINPLSEPMEMPEVKRAVREGETVVISEKDEQPAIAVPIKLRGQVIGVLNIRSQNKERAWDEEELTLVNAIAERASLALENARLVEDAQRRAAKERLIGDIANKISSANNIQNILHTAARELGMAINSSDVTIQFQDEQEP
jgi:GAF domain-containing protein